MLAAFCHWRMTMAENVKRLLTVADFVRLYSVGRTTVFNEMKTGRLRSIVVCGLRRIRIEDAEAWLASYVDNHS